MNIIHLAVAATAAALALPASAATLNFKATLDDLSGLGGSGVAKLQYDNVAQTLAVSIRGEGFAPNMLHVQHIHGPIDAAGNAVDAVSPTLANDADGDGVVELLEGLPLYGGILLNLTDERQADNGFMGFPAVTDTDKGTLTFDAVYDLATTTAFNTGVTAKDLFPLAFREIVIHGAFLPAGVGGVGNETAGDPLLASGGYSNLVPVAAGEISAVPLPASGVLLIGALGGMGALRRARRRA